MAHCFRAGRWRLGHFPSQDRQRKWLPGKGLTPSQVSHPVVRCNPTCRRWRVGAGAGEQGRDLGPGAVGTFPCREDAGEVQGPSLPSSAAAVPPASGRGPPVHPLCPHNQSLCWCLLASTPPGPRVNSMPPAGDIPKAPKECYCPFLKHPGYLT